MAACGTDILVNDDYSGDNMDSQPTSTNNDVSACYQESVHLGVTESADPMAIPDSSDSNSDPESAVEPSPPSSPPPDTSPSQSSRNELLDVEQGSKNVENPEVTQDKRYVRLSEEFTRWPTWSDDPCDLDLIGAFGEEEPNLAGDFNVDGLRPILRHIEKDKWILQDAKGLYYLWDVWDGHLLRVTEEWTTGPELKTIEHVMENIIGSRKFVEDDAVKVFRTYILGDGNA